MADTGLPVPAELQLVRADDQLSLVVDASKLAAHKTAAGWELRPKLDSSGQPVPGRLSLIFPSQQVVEYAAKTTGRPPQPEAIFTDPSHVAFLVPADAAPIPLSVSGILAALPGLALVTTPAAGTVGELDPSPAGGGGNAAALVRDAIESARRGGADAAARAAASRVGDGAPGPGGAELLAERARRAGALQAAASPAPAQRVIAGGAGPATPATAAPDAADLAGTGQAALPWTEVRLPSRLHLAIPGNATRMAHAAAPVEHEGRTELWHTRLARRTKDGRLLEAPTPLKPLPFTEPNPTGMPPSWLSLVDENKINSPLNAISRKQIVDQSVSPASSPSADRLWLSPLGAWLEIEGDWPGKPLRSWTHSTVMGRDQAMRTAQTGQLWPFGFKAYQETTTQRILEEGPGGRVTAALHTRTVIKLRGPRVREFAGGTASGRQWPWASVEILTGVTPPGDVGAGTARVLSVDGRAFRYKVRVRDRAGGTATFDLPMAFVPDGIPPDQIASAWKAASDQLGGDLATLRLRGQAIAVAPPGQAQPGLAAAGASTPDATTVIAKQAVMRLAVVGGQVLPEVESFTGTLPALTRFAPQAAQDLQLQFAEAYRDHGFDKLENAGEALLTMPAQVLDVARELSGGIASPRLAATIMSRLLGPVGGSAGDLASGKLKVRDWISQQLGPVKLFGLIDLAGLLPAELDLQQPDVLGDLRKVPRVLTQTMDGISTQVFTWSTQLGIPPDGIPVPPPPGLPASGRIRPGSGGPPTLTIESFTSVDPPMARADVKIENVELVLGFGGKDLVVLPFRRLEFVSATGKKLDVDVVLGKPGFLGILAFVETLVELIDTLGFSDPPALDVNDQRVRSSFDAPVPQVAIGMFSLENIAFGAALELPFSGGGPTLELNFSTPANPFRMTVSMLGGGGSLGVLVGTGGLIALDGTLEFGAALSVDLKVARGSVSVMGGIRFLLEGSDALLTAYLHIRGELQVLGLISVAMEQLMALTYDPDTRKLSGRAEMAVRVKVLFFKKTVRVVFEKTFAGGNGDPTFAELMAPDGWQGDLPWDVYCTAFAED
ncbi:MAG TPA: hypothetical protein VKG45_02040 [Actinomycetes bacterium]|nr:hypothetical protein [Actinomycetes bacterium]